MKKIVTLFRLIVIVITIPVLFCVLVFSFLIAKPIYDDYVSRVPFERNLWDAAGKSDMKPYRVQMIDDLLSHNEFYEKTKNEVIELIGEPSDTEYFHDWDMVYWLGPERGLFSIDSEWLVFRLNEEGHVADYQIVRD